MSRILIIVFALIAILPAVKAQNLITNPSFETPYNAVTSSGSTIRSGSIATGWSDNSAGNTLNVTYAQDTLTPHSGGSDQVITLNSITTGVLQFVQFQSATAGHQYTASVWVKGSNTGGIHYFVQRSASPYTQYASTVFYPEDDWTRYTITFTATTTETVVLILATNHTGTIAVDDAQMVDNLNTVTNPGFETPYYAVTSTGTATRSGNIATGWSDNSGSSTINEVYSQDTTSPHSGSSDQAVTINSLTSSFWQFGQTQPVIAGHTYTTSIWLKGSTTQPVTFFVQKTTSPYSQYATTSITPVAGWNKYSLTFTAPVTETIVVLLMTWGTGSMSLDDASFVERPNVMLNSSFETPYNPVSISSPGVINGNVANSWYDNTGWNPACNVTYAADAGAHSGTSCQKISVATGYCQLQQDITFIEGRYTATIWVKASTPTWVSLNLAQKYSPYAVYATTPFRATTTWTQVTVTGNTPAVSGLITFNAVGTTPAGSVWIDDGSVFFQGVNSFSQTITTPATVIPSTYFGIHPMHLAIVGSILPWPTITAGTVRQHDCAPKWYDIEMARGVYTWTKLDAFVNAAATAGQQVTFTFAGTPTWATTDTTLDQYGHVGGKGVPSNIVYWTEFVTALVNKYGPTHKIKAYEIWNEPNSGFWNGTPAQMVALEAAAAPIIHAGDPTALVVGPSITIANSPGKLSYYEQYLAAGGGAYSDVLACHLYDNYPEDDTKCVPPLKSLAASYGQSTKPIWNTETGWGFAGTGTGIGQMSMAGTCANVAREYVFNWALGLPNCNWYGWSDVSNVGVDQDGGGAWTILTAGAVAYQQTYNWLNGATMTSCALDGNGTWVARITRSGGYVGYIVWNADTTVSFPKPAGVTQSRNLAGVTTSLASVTSVMVNSTPILLDH
jgi:hypothetical protein